MLRPFQEGFMRRCIFLTFFPVLCLGLFASPAFADKRVALVIGNSAYQSGPLLPNPRHDAEDVAASCSALGSRRLWASILIRPAWMRLPSNLPVLPVARTLRFSTTADTRSSLQGPTI